MIDWENKEQVSIENTEILSYKIKHLCDESGLDIFHQLNAIMKAYGLIQLDTVKYDK